MRPTVAEVMFRLPVPVFVLCSTVDEFVCLPVTVFLFCPTVATFILWPTVDAVHSCHLVDSVIFCPSVVVFMLFPTLSATMLYPTDAVVLL